MGRRKSTVAQGQLWGIDLESALHGSTKARLPCSPAFIGDGPLSITPLQFALVKGIASIEEGKLENPSLWLGFGGTVISANVGLDLHAVAKSAADAAARGQGSPGFRFDIGGSWDDLAFTPDRARAFIRRSGAAAPLFPQKRDAGSLSSPVGTLDSKFNLLWLRAHPAHGESRDCDAP